MNVSIIQSDAEQGSLHLADFHISYTVFHTDSRGAIRFFVKMQVVIITLFVEFFVDYPMLKTPFDLVQK